MAKFLILPPSYKSYIIQFMKHEKLYLFIKCDRFKNGVYGYFYTAENIIHNGIEIPNWVIYKDRRIVPFVEKKLHISISNEIKKHPAIENCFYMHR